MVVKTFVSLDLSVSEWLTLKYKKNIYITKLYISPGLKEKLCHITVFLKEDNIVKMAGAQK